MATRTRLALALAALGSSAAFADGYTAADIQYLIGPDLSHDHPLTLPPLSPPNNPIELFTFEVANGWAYGDNFFFSDIDNAPAFDRTRPVYTYSEWHPRLSAGKISGKDLSLGPISDFLLAGEIDMGSGGEPAYLGGLGLDLKIPGFAFFGLNLFARKEWGQPSVGFQASPYWLLPFKLGPVKMSFGGWFDFMSGTGNQSMWWQTQPTLYVDVGNFWGDPGKLETGIEYEYFHNFTGVNNWIYNHPLYVIKWNI